MSSKALVLAAHPDAMAWRWPAGWTVYDGNKAALKVLARGCSTEAQAWDLAARHLRDAICAGSGGMSGTSGMTGGDWGFALRPAALGKA